METGKLSSKNRAGKNLEAFGSDAAPYAHEYKYICMAVSSLVSIEICAVECCVSWGGGGGQDGKRECV